MPTNSTEYFWQEAAYLQHHMHDAFSPLLRALNTYLTMWLVVSGAIALAAVVLLCVLDRRGRPHTTATTVGERPSRGGRPPLKGKPRVRLGRVERGVLVSGLSIMFLLLALPNASAQPSSAGVWFARAGGDGDGTSAASPLGSTAALEAATRPGDVILLLPGETPLEGGLALKDGQALIGITESGRKPALTNTDSVRNGGNGIVLAQGNRVWNVRIEDTHASGIFGRDVSETHIDAVDVHGANRSGAYTDAEMSELRALPHGGIVFLASGADHSGVNRVVGSEVVDARGFGIASLAFDAAVSRLVIGGTRVEGGTPVTRFDMAVVAMAGEPSSEVDLELTDSTVRGRFSRGGRNVVVLASADAHAAARITRSHLGEVGQDGIIAVVWHVPSTVSVEVVDSIIEKAGATNIEGAIGNLSASDSSRADEARLSVEVVRSIIRDAGAVGGFDNDEPHLRPHNIWVGSTVPAQRFDSTATTPFSRGSYALTVRNSRVEGADGFGVGVGNTGTDWGLEPERSTFDVLLSENTITNNGGAEVLISAPEARIDARRNCWGAAEGLVADRVMLRDTSTRSQIDASEPLSCETQAPGAPMSR